MRGSEGFGVDPNIPGITEMGGGQSRDGWWCSRCAAMFRARDGGHGVPRWVVVVFRDVRWCPRWVVVSEMGGGSRRGPWLANGAGTGVACSPISLEVVLRCNGVVLRFDGVRG